MNLVTNFSDLGFAFRVFLNLLKNKVGNNESEGAEQGWDEGICAHGIHLQVYVVLGEGEGSFRSHNTAAKYKLIGALLQCKRVLITQYSVLLAFFAMRYCHGG